MTTPAQDFAQDLEALLESAKVLTRARSFFEIAPTMRTRNATYKLVERLAGEHVAMIAMFEKKWSPHHGSVQAVAARKSSKEPARVR